MFAQHKNRFGFRASHTYWHYHYNCSMFTLTKYLPNSKHVFYQLLVCCVPKDVRSRRCRNAAQHSIKSIAKIPRHGHNMRFIHKLVFMCESRFFIWFYVQVEGKLAELLRLKFAWSVDRCFFGAWCQNALAISRERTWREHLFKTFV